MTKRDMTRLDWVTVANRMKMAADRAAEIVVVAGTKEPPVDPLEIAATEHRVLKVRGDDFRNRFDGQLEFHPTRKQFLLLFNTKYDRGLPPGEHHPRTRFSIAHELGHFYLDEHQAFLRRGGESHPSQSEFISDAMMEREADAFAAGLLMPEPFIRPLVNEDELTTRRLVELAAQFRTSLVSTAIRAVQVSDFPTAIVGIREGAIAWSFQAPCLVEAGCYPGERGHIRSATTRDKWTAFEAADTEQSTAQAFVKEWFRTYDRDRLETLPVTEHYLPAPVMDTLLVLLTVPEEELFPDSDDDS